MDYHPFGWEMPGRKYNSAEYRYGFNGKEKDDEGEFGSITNYDYGFRIYNPAIGKFLSMDPLTYSYPELTPYQFASNTPIWAADLDGLEAEYRTDGTIWYRVMKGQGFTQITNDLYTSGSAIEWTILRDQNPGTACQIAGCERDDPGNRQYNENPNLFEGQYLYVGLYDDFSPPPTIPIGESPEKPTNIWHSPEARVSVPDIISIGVSYNAIYGVGPGGAGGKLNWITRGPDASLWPVVTTSVNSGVGFDIDATLDIGGYNFLGPVDGISKDFLNTNYNENGGFTTYTSFGIAEGGKIGLTFTAEETGTGKLIGRFFNIGAGIPVGPLPFNGSAGVSQSFPIGEEEKTTSEENISSQ